jgi:CheY-like chemotaxis protein
MPTLSPPKKILTVDDNAIVSADVRTILEAAGYEVCPDARDGVQALEHVREYEPDLILLDLKLPRLDGVETASLIREESDAPILVLTGYDDPELSNARRPRERVASCSSRSASTACSRPSGPASRSATPRTSVCAA